MIRYLAKKLTAFTEFSDFVIIEIEFRRGKFEPTAQVLKAYSATALLSASSTEVQVLVKMIHLRREINVALCSRIQSAENFWRIFTAEEILQFAEAVGDKNKIHKLSPPIVPAFLILEKICAEFKADFVKLKFKNFITAGEPISLHSCENKFELSSANIKKVTGEFL